MSDTSFRAPSTNEAICYEIEEVFAQLESVSSPVGQAGALERRLLTASPCDLFIGVQKPSNTRLLRARFRTSALSDQFSLPKFRELELTQRIAFEDRAERLIVQLRSPSPAYNDVFTAFAEDIGKQLGSPAEEAEAAEAFRRRLVQWQRLLLRKGTEGLTPEEQRGLYGELYFIRHFLLPKLSLLSAVSAWTGPEDTPKDFQFPEAHAVEVKTTLARLPQVLQINGERQLDDNGLTALYLFHLSMDANRGAGETLPEMVASLRTATASEPAALAILDDRLLNVGYLDIHAGQYAGLGYVRRTARIYKVADGFPRIIESNLLSGVGDVRYGISAVAMEPFSVAFEDFQKEIVTCHEG